MNTFGQEKILIVEDEPSIQRLYASLLLKNFPAVCVDSVFDGFEAVDHFYREQPGTVLLDFNLPVLNGLTTCFHLHKICSEKGWELPNFIICSAAMNMEERSTIHRLRPVPTVLAKPVQNSALVNTLRLAFSKALPQ